MSAATLSIVIPFLNEMEVLPLLRERLTLARPAAPNWEIVFVSDGSTGGSVAFIPDWFQQNRVFAGSLGPKLQLEGKFCVSRPRRRNSARAEGAAPITGQGVPLLLGEAALARGRRMGAPVAHFCLSAKRV